MFPFKLGDRWQWSALQRYAIVNHTSENEMNQSGFSSPTDRTTTVGRIFDVPLVAKGFTWLPAVQLLWWAAASWITGRRHPQWTGSQRLLSGLGATVVMLGSEWCHNLAHAAAARWVGQPMDALRIVGGMPLIIYSDPENPNVTPRQHILRSLGGPACNTVLLGLSRLLRPLTAPDTVGRAVVNAATGMNALLLSASLLPIPGIDGGPVLKWSLVELGQTPPQAAETLKKVNRVTWVGLGLAAALALKKRRRLVGIVLALFSALSLAFGFGWLKER